MENRYGVSKWPDVAMIAKKMDALVNDKLYNIKPEAMERYLSYFATKCQKSQALNEEAKS